MPTPATTSSEARSNEQGKEGGIDVHSSARLEGRTSYMKNDGYKNRCRSRTKEDKPCRAAVTEGGLCFFHGNPNKASELGRIGGRSKRHAAAEACDPLPPLDTPIAVRDRIDRLFADVYSGKVRSSVARDLAPLLSLQFRVSERTDLQEEIAKLQQQLAEIKDTLSGGSSNAGLA
jgi:hypothetical protein